MKGRLRCMGCHENCPGEKCLYLQNSKKIKQNPLNLTAVSKRDGRLSSYVLKVKKILK